MSNLRNCFNKIHLKSTVQHVGLLSVLMIYTAVGGLIFRQLEQPAEISRINNFNNIITTKRLNLMHIVANNSLDNEYKFSEELLEYEKLLEDAVFSGYHVNTKNSYNTEKWTYLKAVFFSSTVLTTIGYGDLVPVTLEGRAFCIVFALIGIPLTLTVIADLGRLLATFVSAFIRYISPEPSLRNVSVTQRTSLYAFLAVGFLFVYLSAGAGLFVIWEDGWTFMDGFYFCFITMTTIGFGDLVPKKPKYMLLCTFYILLGLALTSTIIELVRRQYVQSWRQLQALRGPLAENFKRIAENTSGLDIMAFQHDIMKVLTVVTIPRSAQFGGKRDRRIQKEWQETIDLMVKDMTLSNTMEQKKLVQVVIYESSI